MTICGFATKLGTTRITIFDALEKDLVNTCKIKTIVAKPCLTQDHKAVQIQYAISKLIPKPKQNHVWLLSSLVGEVNIMEK